MISNQKGNSLRTGIFLLCYKMFWPLILNSCLSDHPDIIARRPYQVQQKPVHAGGIWCLQTLVSWQESRWFSRMRVWRAAWPAWPRVSWVDVFRTLGRWRRAKNLAHWKCWSFYLFSWTWRVCGLSVEALHPPQRAAAGRRGPKSSANADI